MLTFFVASALATDIEMSWSARILDTNGDTPNGDATFTVALHTSDVAAAHWFDEFTVPANDGYVTAILGSDKPLPDSALAYPEVWLSVTMNSTELDRQKLLSVPSAVRAQRLVDGAVAEGVVYLGDTPGASWCDTTTYPSREGALVYDRTQHKLQVCTPGGWTSTGGRTLVNTGAGWRWSDGTAAGSCEDYRRPDSGSTYNNEGDGLYLLDTNGDALGDRTAYCDMSRYTGGWTRCFAVNEAADPNDYTFLRATWGASTPGIGAAGMFCNTLTFTEMLGESWASSGASSPQIETGPVPAGNAFLTVPSNAAFTGTSGCIGVTQRSAGSPQLTQRGNADCGLRDNGQLQGSGLVVADGTNYRMVNGELNNNLGFRMCTLSSWCGSDTSAWVVLYVR